MRRIAVINQKGGTGKTTSVANLAVGLTMEGKKVLMVDVDPQGNLGVWFDAHPQKTLFHLLVEGASPKECIIPVKDGLHLLGSNRTAAQAEMILVGQPAREKVLSRRLKTVSGYDYVLLDCAPALNLLNQNALIYAQEAIIPISMEYLSLVGVLQMLENIRMINDLLDHQLEIELVIPTFFDKRNKKSHEVLYSLKKHFGDKVTNPVRTNVRLSEAPSHHQSIYEYAPNSYGAQDYRKIVRRILNGRENSTRK